ncbi:hypothetical protein D3C87_1785020 [compost metagenome]
MACSATASGEYAGTRKTGIPNCVAYLTSTLLNPAHRKTTNRSPESFNLSSISRFSISLTKMQMASYPAANENVSSERDTLKNLIS